MKVKITKSNCTLFRPGDEAVISTHNGRDRIFSERLNLWEWLSWVEKMFSVEYEKVPEPPSE